MSRNVYVASPEDGSGKSTVALGLVTLLGRLVGKVGIFRPVVDSSRPVDRVVELLLAQPAVDQEYADAIGVGSQEWRADTGNALARIVDRFQDLGSRYDALVVVGSDDELGATTAIAANLGAPVVLVVHGRRTQRRAGPVGRRARQGRSRCGACPSGRGDREPGGAGFGRPGP